MAQASVRAISFAEARTRHSFFFDSDKGHCPTPLARQRQTSTAGRLTEEAAQKSPRPALLTKLRSRIAGPTPNSPPDNRTASVSRLCSRSQPVAMNPFPIAGANASVGTRRHHAGTVSRSRPGQRSALVLRSQKRARQSSACSRWPGEQRSSERLSTTSPTRDQRPGKAALAELGSSFDPSTELCVSQSRH